MRARVRPAEAGQAHRRGYHNEYYDKTRLRRQALARAAMRARRQRCAWRALLDDLLKPSTWELTDYDPTDS